MSLTSWISKFPWDFSSNTSPVTLNDSDIGKTKGELADKFEAIGIKNSTRATLKHPGRHEFNYRFDRIPTDAVFKGREGQNPPSVQGVGRLIFKV